MTVIQQVAPNDNEEETLKELHRLFNDQGHSDYVVVYLRLITSGQLQEGADFYQNFIDGNCTMEEFRHQEVEPMYKESDHIHIIGEFVRATHNCLSKCLHGRHAKLHNISLQRKRFYFSTWTPFIYSKTTTKKKSRLK